MSTADLHRAEVQPLGIRVTSEPLSNQQNKPAPSSVPFAVRALCPLTESLLPVGGKQSVKG